MKWTGVVTLCHVCVISVVVVKCLAMSTSELEDFSNFLHETSRLDQILKKTILTLESLIGNIPEDDVDHFSENAWEESGKFEGDLILNEKQRKMIVNVVAQGLARNGVSDTTKRWPNNEVVYKIQEKHFSSGQIEAIMNGMNDLAGASCIKFRPFAEGDSSAVIIQGNRRGCFSQVGYQGGFQVLNLSGRHPVGRGCFRHGTVVHEMLHTLGFYHTHSSTDRDDYINVVWENIYERAIHNFKKYDASSITDFGVGYDYDSVLHYSGKAFSTNGRDTLVPKQRGASIGQRIGLSEKDTQKLNKMYCDAGLDNPVAQDESSVKKIKKLKKEKNKPFEGHGIGYQQGKTVIIKLPKAKDELPDSSQITVFDYFNKPSQDFQSKIVQGTEDDEEAITKFYRPAISSNIEEYEKPIFVVNPQDHLYDKEQIIKQPYTEEKRGLGKDKPSDINYDDLSEAFYRLSNIKKPQVYSEQTINNHDYTDNYGFEKNSDKYEDSPYKQKAVFTQHYVPKSISTYNPLVNKPHDSFSLVDHHFATLDKRYHDNEFNHKHYRDRNPTLFDIYR